MYYELQTTHFDVCGMNGSIELQCKQKHKHFMEEKWTAVDSVFTTICECCVELREKWMVLIRSLLLYILSLILSLFPTHTSKASQQIAVICCCAWIFFSLVVMLCFHFSIYAVCVKYFILLSVAFYSCDACQTFGCMFDSYSCSNVVQIDFFSSNTHQTHFSFPLVHHINFYITKHLFVYFWITFRLCFHCVHHFTFRFGCPQIRL